MAIRTLIVDDHDDMREVLRLMATRSGACVVAVVPDGKAALAVLAISPIDLLLTDYQMPGMDGITLAHTVHQQWPKTVVVLVTACPDPLLIDAARDAMIFTILEKPVSMTKLGQLVCHVEHCSDGGPWSY